MNIEINRMSTATMLGIFTSGVMFGGSMASAYYAVPGLLKPLDQPAISASKNDSQQVTLSSRHVAQQWRELFVRGATGGPIATGTAIISWLYVAWALPAERRMSRNLYLAGAATAFSIFPFTRVFMLSSILALFRHADGKEVTDESEQSDPSVKDLLSSWSHLAFARGCIPGIGVGFVLAANMI